MVLARLSPDLRAALGEALIRGAPARTTCLWVDHRETTSVRGVSRSGKVIGLLWEPPTRQARDPPVRTRLTWRVWLPVCFHTFSASMYSAAGLGSMPWDQCSCSPLQLPSLPLFTDVTVGEMLIGNLGRGLCKWQHDVVHYRCKQGQNTEHHVRPPTLCSPDHL